MRLLILLGLVVILAGCVYAPNASVPITVHRTYSATNMSITQDINPAISPSLNPSANLIGK